VNRHDWVFVGIRLLGVFLIVIATLGFIAAALNLFVVPGEGASREGAGQLVGVGLTAWIGTVLCLGAPGIVSWLRKRDDAVTDRPVRAERPIAER